jgi:hypothetical protein
MTIEQQLTQAFRRIDEVEPSPDLWNRVLHSIDEEREHRRRVVSTVGAMVAALAAVALVAAIALRENGHGQYVDRPTMEALETAVLVSIVLALGPAIRRFGRGYAVDLWPAGTAVPAVLLRLLDLAYFLVFSGYILLSAEFEFGDEFRFVTFGEQIGEASLRVGGLLFLVGVLHAVTIAMLPVVALVDNSTRAGKPLPRWLVVVGVIIAIQTLPGTPIIIVMFVVGAG